MVSAFQNFKLLSYRKALKNINSILKPGGDCLIAFLTRNPIFEIYDQLSRSVKWSKYMYDVKKFISPYQYSENPASEFGDLLFASGFSDFTIEVQDKIFVYEGIDNLKSEYNIQFFKSLMKLYRFKHV